MTDKFIQVQYMRKTRTLNGIYEYEPTNLIIPIQQLISIIYVIDENKAKDLTPKGVQKW